MRRPSQIMVDKPMTVKRERIGEAFGHLEDSAMVAVNRALALFLGFS
ncbi:mRNA interferase MazF [Halomonas cerina]|uniref:mRNA interferase MazF n=1 Tax=Halomonas cerina TaxID=447424 RepID=A0A839VJR6_9GAMM|nr:mRNA interferase MazF [Halomonas cerina]